MEWAAQSTHHELLQFSAAPPIFDPGRPTQELEAELGQGDSPLPAAQAQASGQV